MALHVVCRPIPGPAGDIPSGQLVDASKWRNAEFLESQRYLRPVNSADENVLGDLTVEIDENGISNVNLNDPPTKKAPMKVRKKKR